METLQDIFKRIEQAQQDIASICAKINQKENKLDDYDIKNILFVARELQENAVLLSHYKSFEKKLTELQNTIPNQTVPTPIIQPIVTPSPQLIKTEEKVNVIPIVTDEMPQVEPIKEEKSTLDITPQTAVFEEINEVKAPVFEEIKPQIPEENIIEIVQQLEAEITQTIETFSSNKTTTSNVNTANKSIFEKFAEDKTSDNSLANKLSKTKIKDLAASIGLNEKFLFANELFDGNSSLFNQEIQNLNTFNSANEALSYFNDLQQKLNWNTESKALEKLKDLVERRYL